jgi:hypothetical protein
MVLSDYLSAEDTLFTEAGAGDPLGGCAVADLYEGPWRGIEARLRELGIDAVPTSVRRFVCHHGFRPHPKSVTTNETPTS